MSNRYYQHSKWYTKPDCWGGNSTNSRVWWGSADSKWG